nr:hypothetical protein Iba_chr04eCG2590 [Ipomoea batatas]
MKWRSHPGSHASCTWILLEEATRVSRISFKVTCGKSGKRGMVSWLKTCIGSSEICSLSISSYHSRRICLIVAFFYSTMLNFFWSRLQSTSALPE